MSRGNVIRAGGPVSRKLEKPGWVPKSTSFASPAQAVSPLRMAGSSDATHGLLGLLMRRVPTCSEKEAFLGTIIDSSSLRDVVLVQYQHLSVTWHLNTSAAKCSTASHMCTAALQLTGWHEHISYRVGNTTYS